MKLSLLAGAAALLSGIANAATPDEWRKQSIYFLLTDRFARADNSTTATCNVEDRVIYILIHIHSSTCTE